MDTRPNHSPSTAQFDHLANCRRPCRVPEEAFRQILDDNRASAHYRLLRIHRELVQSGTGPAYAALRFGQSDERPSTQRRRAVPPSCKQPPLPDLERPGGTTASAVDVCCNGFELGCEDHYRRTQRALAVPALLQRDVLYRVDRDG